MLKDFLIGALIGEFLLFVVIFFSYRTHLIYDFDGWFKKHSKSLFRSMVLAGLFFGSVIAFSDGSSSSCKEFGRYASNC